MKTIIRRQSRILSTTLLWALLSIFFTSTLSGQDDFIYSKKFTKTLERHNLEFYLPVERWMKISPIDEDEFLKYDAIFHNPPNVEARVVIKKDHNMMFANVEIVKMLAHISTNEDDAVIEITEYPSKRSQDQYGADFVLYADFIPKQSFTTMPRGRLLCLYKEGQSLVQYIILYEGSLDPYFKMPLRFAEINLQE